MLGVELLAMDLDLNLEALLRQARRSPAEQGHAGPNSALTWPAFAASLASSHALRRAAPSPVAQFSAACGAQPLTARRGSFDIGLAGRLAVLRPTRALDGINPMPLGDGKRIAGKEFGIAGQFSPATEV